MANVKNEKLMELKGGLDDISRLAPKAGLFGFKYATAVAAINPPALRAITAVNETLAAHVLKDVVPKPGGKDGETIEVWRPHPTVPGGWAVDEEFDKLRTEILEAEIEIAVWPPVMFNAVDFEKAQIELPNRCYVVLRDLMVFPSVK